MNFFSWYFGAGFRRFVEYYSIWLAFLWRLFHIEHHIRTLFAPWHKDVSFRRRPGLHPILWARRLADNLFARFMGMNVRIATILTGFVVMAVYVVFHALAIVVWYTLPFYLLGVVILMLQGTVVAWVIGGLLLLVPAVLYYGIARVYMHERGTKDYRALSMRELDAEPWFERVYQRVGLSRADITPEMLADFARFEEVLAQQDVSVEEFERILAWEISVQEKKDRHAAWWREENLRTIRPIGQYWAYGYTIHLDRYSTDLSRHDSTDYADAEFTGRQEAVNMLLLTLERPGENNAFLVGDAGVGKKTLLHSIARKLRTGAFDHNPLLRDKRILLVDMAQALADAQHNDGGVDLFLHQIFHEAAYAGNVIIVVDNFHRYVRDAKASYDITPIIAEYLHLPTFQLIALTSRKAYNTELSQRDDLLKYFTTITIEELDEPASIHALLGKFAALERDSVLFTYGALRDIVRLSGRYRADAPLPERAVDLATEVVLYWKNTGARARIDGALVRDFLTTKTGMPMGAIDGAEKEKLLNMEKILHEKIIGQDDAVRQVAEAVRIMRSGITDTSKPMSSFLFLGPTGVGKTETAKALADVYYGSADAMIRIDMSEFQGADAFKLLIGDEETGELGRLTTAAKEHPYALLLLDELEKAHPRALDLFLQILDEGFVTDAFGDRVNFRNMIIIATSNAGAVFLADQLAQGVPVEDIKQPLIDKIVHDGIYRLEFLNRFSDIILFRPLTQEELHKVVRLMFGRLTTRLKKEKNITLTIDDDVIDVVVRKGYNTTFGARSIARYIDDKISDVIARKIIAGDVVRGGSVHIAVSDLDED